MNDMAAGPPLTGDAVTIVRLEVAHREMARMRDEARAADEKARAQAAEIDALRALLGLAPINPVHAKRRNMEP